MAPLRFNCLLEKIYEILAIQQSLNVVIAHRKPCHLVTTLLAHLVENLEGLPQDLGLIFLRQWLRPN